MPLAQRLAVLTVFVTAILIGVGVYVRASGSGLGCPDWPLCHGSVIPPTESHHTLIEFSHRLVASITGLLVIAVAVAAWRAYRSVPLVVWPAVALVPLVGFQGLLGAITVWRELPPEIVASHLVLAMIILAAMILVAGAMLIEDPAHARRARELRASFGGPVARRTMFAMAWLVAAMWVGAYTAESGAASACGSWPVCTDTLLPAADEHEIVHMLHRVLAGGLLLPLGLVVAAVWRQSPASRMMRSWTVALVGLFAVQVALGAFNVWFEFPDALTVAHTVVATAIWALLAGGTVIGCYAPAARTARQPLQDSSTSNPAEAPA